MMTIDKILIKILNQCSDCLAGVSSRDKKVLKSLEKIINSPNFITENQGKLLIKILTENVEKFGSLRSEVETSLSAPLWTKAFRAVDKTKKIYLSTDIYGLQTITIEFAFSSVIRKVLSATSKNIAGLTQEANGKIYRADLTEQNIVALVELLEPLGFDISEKIQDFYKTIKSWSEIEVKNQFLITNITHSNFQKSITADLGLETAIDKSVISDRSVRYQYFCEKTEKEPENLVEKIAYRASPKVWINKKETSLNEIFYSLKKMKRLPTLVIFDSHDGKKCLEELKILQESLERNGIVSGVGIYFRLANDDTGSQFNKFIAEHQYNSELNSDTKIVGVQNGKIPKFFLKNEWKPMSVISIGNYLKQTKTAVYANQCDLIISYTDQEPIIETRTVWE